MSHPVLIVSALVSSNQKWNKGRRCPCCILWLTTHILLEILPSWYLWSTLTWPFILFSGHSVSGASSSAYSLNTSPPQTSIHGEMYVTPSLPSLLNFSVYFEVFLSPWFLLSGEKRGWLNTGKRRRENTCDKKIKLLEAEGQRFTTYSQSLLAYFVQRHCFGMRRGWFLCLQFRTSYLMFLLMYQTQSQCLWR